MPEQQEQGAPAPYFDDTRKALAFALNFREDVKAPTMSRMMAQVKAAPKKLSKAARKRFLAQFEWADASVYALALELLEGEMQGRKKGSSFSRPSAPKGLDGAHLAGYIVAHFERLDRKHQLVLRGVTCRAHDPCSCGSMCCSGWRRTLEWSAAVRETCELLAAIAKQPGKRGLSSPPDMRLKIVVDYYQRRSTTLSELAGIGQVALNTAAKHKEHIVSFLQENEDEAWRQLDAIFDGAGITGAFT